MEKSFKCENCNKAISTVAIGTKNRNHCPHCLWSKHVDKQIGDRQASCQGLMKPIGLTTKKDGEIILVHQCLECRKISTNRIAGDDDCQAIEKIFFEQVIKTLKDLGIDPFIDEGELLIQLYGKKYDQHKNL